MEFYLKIHFVILLISFALGSVLMGVRDYPRKRPDETIGTVLAGLVLTLALLVWVGIILFVKPQ